MNHTNDRDSTKSGCCTTDDRSSKRSQQRNRTPGKPSSSTTDGESAKNGHCSAQREPAVQDKNTDRREHSVHDKKIGRHKNTEQQENLGDTQNYHGSRHFEIVEPVLPENLSCYIEALLDAIQTAFPLSAAHKKNLQYAIRELSRDLTSERTERRKDYLGMPRSLAAYLNYFLPWNVLRISQIIANLEIKLSSGDSILDIGSGPWTVPIAFWIARPELRSVKLHWILGDRVKKPLESGKAIFTAFIQLAANLLSKSGDASGSDGASGNNSKSGDNSGDRLSKNSDQDDISDSSTSGKTSQSGSASYDELAQNCPWEFTCVREQFPSLALQKRDRPFALITAANVLNELFWDDRIHLDVRAQGVLKSFAGNTVPGTRVLIIEPGEPRSGTMLAALRESTIIHNGTILGPCTHAKSCPMPGSYLSAAMRAIKSGKPFPKGVPEPVNMPASRTKYPWCHFVLNAKSVPKQLQKLSIESGIPKDRLVASWLYAELPHKHAKVQKSTSGCIRLVSDKIVVEGNIYRYACGEPGYIMAGRPFSAYPSGTVVRLENLGAYCNKRVDKKTHALILE